MKLGHISFLVLFTNRDVPCLDGGSLPFSHNAGHITREKCHRHFYSLPQRRVQSAVNLFGVSQKALSFFCRNIALIITTSLSVLNTLLHYSVVCDAFPSECGHKFKSSRACVAETDESSFLKLRLRLRLSIHNL